MICDGRAWFEFLARARRLPQHAARPAPPIPLRRLPAPARGARISCTARRRCLVDQHRHLGQLRPGGDEDRHGRAVGRVLARPRFGVDDLAFFDRVLELTCSVATSNSSASSFSVASSAPGRRPRAPRLRPARMLTVRVTAGFEQKRVRKEQSSSASPPGGEGRGSCSSTVPGSTCLCDLDLAAA